MKIKIKHYYCLLSFICFVITIIIMSITNFSVVIEG